MHRPLSSSDPHMRSFDSVILPLRLVMRGVEAQITKRCRIGPPFIGDDSSRCETMLLQKLTHQLERSSLVPLGLDEDIKDSAVLVDGPPQIHPATADRDVHLVEMPLWMCLRSVAPEASTNWRPEPDHPSPNCFIGDRNAARGHKLFDVAEAEIEPGVQPDGALDD